MQNAMLDADVDIDDPFDTLKMLSLDLPQEELIKIIHVTKKTLPSTLPIYHYKSNNLQDADPSKHFVILKYPYTNKYLLFNSHDFYLLQGGRNDVLKEEKTMASFFARKCFDIFNIFKRKNELAPGKAIILPNLEPIVKLSEIPTVKDVVSRYSYANRTTNFIHLPTCWTEEASEFKDIYPSFGEWKSFAEDFSKPITIQQFNQTVLGRGSSVLLPSEVTAVQAWQCLQMQAKHDWSINIEDIKIQKQHVALKSMSLDLDYGLVSLLSCNVGKPALGSIIQAVEFFLPQTQLVCRTAYVPNGKNWMFASDVRFLPTIYDKSSTYVLVPTPEHSVEVCKMWFFVSRIDQAPEKFLSKIKEAFQNAARSIVDLDTSCSSETKRISISVIDSNSTSQATMIRGGVLLPIVSFLFLSQTVPDVQLVIETYNGKQKGLSVNVSINGDGTPSLDIASNSLIQAVVNSESILFTISKLCKEGLVQVDSARSSLGFGFRTCHKVQKSDDIAYSMVEFNQIGREIQYPMGYLPSLICPKLNFGPFYEKENDSTTRVQTQAVGEVKNIASDVTGIRRVQSYLEYFSMQKASNHHQQHSYHKTESNLATATKSHDTQDSLNLSALKVSLQETLQRLDQSFRNFRDIGGTRTEIAIQPIISRNESCLVFDIEECIVKCWQILVEKTVFYRNVELSQYGAVNTAACVLGYRFALDELSETSNRALEDTKIQQHTFGFMRYMNSVLNTICNGRYVNKNPKLFLSELGSKVGRSLNLIPDIPHNVSERICEYVQVELPAVEAPKSPTLTIRENLIQSRIDENVRMGEMRSIITVCYGCGKCFYGSRETQAELLHKHLAKYAKHSNADWRQRSVTGSVWEADWIRRQTKVKKVLYAQGNESSDEQRMAYELLFGSNGYKSRNLCLVGVPGSGKTWMVKKLSKLLECVFFHPGEVIRCGPLGRVACSFHLDARTIHSTLQIRPNRHNQYPESLEDLQIHLNQLPQENFGQLKVLIVSEALMCTGPHLEALLLHIKHKNPNCIFLFDGDCQQVTVKPTTGYPSQPFVTRPEFEVVCPETTTIILEKCTKHRIKNPEKLHHLGLMRNGQATEATVCFFQQTKCVHQQKKSIIRLFANSRPAAKFNDDNLASILKSSPSLLQKLHAKDTWKGTKNVAKMTVAEEASLPVDEVINVVKGAPILIVQNHVAELLFEREKSGHRIYVGNGTTGIFWEYEAHLDAIIVKVDIASKFVYVRIKRRDFSTTTKTRNQFPFMLAWAATIHKVQGMEFDCIEVDFCLDTISNSGESEFYQGLAYMALSRAENVLVIGRLTLALLNNINRQSLLWWKIQVSKWISFKKANKNQIQVFRNAIHMHNWHAAACQRNIQKSIRRCTEVAQESYANTKALQTLQSSSNVTNAAIPDSAASALLHANNGALGLSSDLDKELKTKERKRCLDGSSSKVKQTVADDPFDAVEQTCERPIFSKIQDTSVKKQKDVIVKNVIRQGFAPTQNAFCAKFHPSMLQLSNMLSKSIDSLNMPEFRCKHHGHVDTYGEATPALITYMMQQYSKVCDVDREKVSTFVDLGSGCGGLVCLMAAFRRFKACFGVEFEPLRASYADPLAEHFLQQLQKKNMRYSSVHINFGDFFDCETTKTFLMHASLVWINNVKFQDINYRLLLLLDNLVPVGCVVVSFESFLNRRHNESRFRKISEELVANAADWTDSPQMVYVIQKQS